MKSPVSYFSEITAPRIERGKEHSLSDIIFITIAAVICGAESWNDIESFEIAKKEWLQQYLKLPNGIPSHDTFNRVHSILDPKELEKCFLEWVNSVCSLTEKEVISIDGKALRGSKKYGSKAMVHMVSAWAQHNHIVLGQVKVDEKSNEITAIPKLLEVLAIKGCIITIDAMGCQTEIAKQIISKEADHILAVKGNQGTLEQGINDTIRFSAPKETYTDIDAGHGRIETRVCSVNTDLSHIENSDKWSKLSCVVKIESLRHNKLTSREQNETRLYISSTKPSAKLIAESVRAHWGIENSLHWVLDEAFNEDKSMKTNTNGAQNFSIINRIALNLVKNEKSKKVGIKGRRLAAGWDNDFLLKILTN
ncbi:MAG: ISAs1 family transposase [bacterium]|nr:ISAs1 family transposase [bacterium]